jgi:pyridoxamine 5'-phosphate oxidase
MRAGMPDPNAMTLATCSPEGKPSARIVLLKDYSAAGFSFFTNYESRKGRELLANPNAALVLFWKELHRQVRIEGRVEKLDAEASASYFQSRPRGSQVGAWASPQSSVLPDRQTLVEQAEKTERQYEGLEKLPLPGFWGGYLLRPETVEFWQGQPNRLHDRIRYVLKKNGAWKMERLAP